MSTSTGQSRLQPLHARHRSSASLTSVDRQLARLADRIAAKHVELADHDQSDHVAITRLTAELRALEDEVGALESRWLELSEAVE